MRGAFARASILQVIARTTNASSRVRDARDACVRDAAAQGIRVMRGVMVDHH
jgi:hypothetical protein